MCIEGSWCSGGVKLVTSSDKELVVTDESSLSGMDSP